MLQACLNGGRRKAEAPGAPESPSELAADARAVREAGAEALHIHPRAASGAESLAPEDMAAALEAVRAAAPGMPVGVATGAWIAPGGRARHALMAAWTTRPDYASVNLSEEDAPETIRLMLSMGVGVEAGVWNAADAERFAALPERDQCLRVLLETTMDDPDEARATYRAARQVLEEEGVALPLLLHGEGGSVWPMVAQAARDGLDTRVGFEDGLHLPDGRVASSNAEIVRAALSVMASAQGA